MNFGSVGIEIFNISDKNCSTLATKVKYINAFNK